MDKKDSLMLFFVLFVITFSIITKMGFGGIMSQISIFILFIGYYMSRYYENEETPLLFLTIVVMAILIFSNFRTFSALSTDEHLSRAMVRDDEETYEYIRKGIGGYGLIYPQVCICPLFVAWTVSAFKKNKFCFILGVTWIISYVLLVFHAGYMIAMVVSVVGFALALSRSRKSLFYSLFISLGIILALYLLIGYSSGFRSFLLEMFKGSNAITFKIDDIYNTFWGLGDAHNVEVRAEAYLLSLKGIVTYPIIGGLGNAILGSHSAVLDTIAIYGWFGGYAYLSMVLHVPVVQKKRSRDGYVKKVANSVIATTLIVGCLNTFPYQIAMAVTVISLGLFKDIINWRKKT